MTTPAQFEILDLRHFSAASLRPVLEAEREVWGKLLQWDYRSSIDLLLQYLDARVLPGFVAVANGHVLGYTFCVYEARKAVIGDIFSLPDNALGIPEREIEEALLSHMLSLLQNSPGIDRIESQLLLHSHESHSALFSEQGFSIHPRLFMDLDLTGPAARAGIPNTQVLDAKGLLIRPWRETDFQAAGPLIAAAYDGHLDSAINDQYRSVAGSLRFLHNIIRFPGCGVFDPRTSHVAADRSSGALAGLVLCSRIRSDVQHVTQLCVAPHLRSSGVGSLLLGTAIASLASTGFRTLSLTVTGGNTRAAALYRRLGFVERHIFNAIVWDNGLREPLPPLGLSRNAATAADKPIQPRLASAFSSQ